MTDYRALSGILTASLGLKHDPVAVCLTDTVPDGVPRVQGQSPAGCRFWQDGAAATFATSADDHSLCAIGMFTHNLPLGAKNEEDLTDALRVFADLGYVRKEDIPSIPVLETRPANIVYG